MWYLLLLTIIGVVAVVALCCSRGHSDPRHEFILEMARRLAETLK